MESNLDKILFSFQNSKISLIEARNEILKLYNIDIYKCSGVGYFCEFKDKKNNCIAKTSDNCKYRFKL